ncbi:cation efflux family protein family [Diaporthe amygdali]|uniref:cation efflux family protein family n=1 Tax=Phomopsis amygdali TaxID=1214568 RepID=UPI0022FF32D0|nr:cation efflux family protein family [Diaporthe amygdali]KAJ0108036.1 cation efflux family protein family [Diaporthe amygdali]
MASGLPPDFPPPSPTPPLLVEPPPEDEVVDLDLALDSDFDVDRPASRASATSSIGNWNDIGGLLLSPNSASLLSPDTPRSIRRPASSMSTESALSENGLVPAAPAPGPFNFQTQSMSTSPVRSNIGQRRGHRYKHSSISTQHQIFQEPPPRPPPVLPASLPVPTLKEAWGSMHKDQRVRLYWSLCHACVAGYVFFSAGGSLAMTALSHLVFFDVGSAAICVCVDVLGNFEVWRRSSIRHPFGLQRVEVLAGFAMSVFLVFGGFDLLSHNFKHVLESVGSHAPHHPHGHGHGHGGDEGAVSAGAVDVATLAAVLSTLVSAYGLKNHARIRRVMRPSYFASFLPEILANPFHSLTLFFSFLMLMLPLLPMGSFAWLDKLICVAIAVSMFVLGMRLAVAQGLMLLMSYSGRQHKSSISTSSSAVAATFGVSGAKHGGNSDADDVVREIESEPNVSRVDEAQFWQVHYGLCMATLKLCVARGCDDAALSLLRQRVGRIVQNRLGEGYGKGGALRWEVTLQTSTDAT